MVIDATVVGSRESYVSGFTPILQAEKRDLNVVPPEAANVMRSSDVEGGRSGQPRESG